MKFKILHIILIIFAITILTSCSNKQTKPVVVETNIDYYLEAIKYEDDDGNIQGDNYKQYKYFLDKAIESKNLNAYFKSYQNYNMLYGKRAYIDGNYMVVQKRDIRKAHEFALLIIENRSNSQAACEMIKKIDNQNNFTKNQSYRIYLANEFQGCSNIEDKLFDYKFTPASVFITKTPHKALVLGQMIDKYAKKALDGSLEKSYVNFDNRWIMLSRYALALSIINKKNKKLSKMYHNLAEDIIKSIPLNKNRYFRYDLKNKNKKIYYHVEQQNKLISEGIAMIKNSQLNRSEK